MEDKCWQKTCPNHGTCDAKTGECSCEIGYSGPDCSSCAGGFKKRSTTRGCVPVFGESRMLTPEWGGQLNVWAVTEGQEWSLCCSTFEGCDTGAKFQQLCGAHSRTLTVVHNSGGTALGATNPGNFTFGGFVREPSRSLFSASQLKYVHGCRLRAAGLSAPAARTT